MPVYVYKCDTCGVAFERKQSVSEPHLTDCPECEGQVRRVFQPVGVLFKGSGFYVTDSRPKSASGERSSGGSNGGSASSESGDKPSTEKPATEKAPAEAPAKSSTESSTK